jgi:hypothetical protein
MKFKKTILYGGILGPITYLLNDIIGGFVTPNYNYVVNTVSDLTKSGSTYMLGSIILLISTLMGFAFGIGIMSHYKNNRLISRGGLFLAVIGFLNIFTATIFPQDTIGGVVTFPGTMHLVLVGMGAVILFPTLIMMAVGLYREKQWILFRLYTLISIIIMFVFGGLSVIVIMNGVEMIGLVERVSVYTFQLWSMVLALSLIKENRYIIKAK